MSLPSAYLFFFGKRKILGQSDDAKKRKKRGWPYELGLVGLKICKSQVTATIYFMGY